MISCLVLAANAAMISQGRMVSRSQPALFTRALITRPHMRAAAAPADTFDTEATYLEKLNCALDVLHPDCDAVLVPQDVVMDGVNHTSGALSKWRGLLGLFGGSLIHLSCGSMYCWGNLLSYMPPHLKYWSGSAAAAAGGMPDAQFVLAWTILSQMVGMPIGPALERSGLGPRRTALLGAVLMGSGVLLASTASSLATFVLGYCVIFGLGVGIACTWPHRVSTSPPHPFTHCVSQRPAFEPLVNADQMPIMNGAKWFPRSTGGVSGAVIFGMGASAFFFNMLATRLVNPTGVNPIAGAFPAAVYARWPSLLRTLGSIYLTVGVVGAMLQQPPTASATSVEASVGPPASSADLTDERSKASRAAGKSAGGGALLSDVTSRPFATLWSMILLSAIGGLNTASSYKMFGVARAHLNSDGFLSLVGGLASLLGNAAGRLFWGSRSDKQGFRRTFIELAALQAVTMASYLFLSSSRLGFAAATILMLFCMGGTFAMFPAQAMRSAWKASAASVYGLMFSAFALAALGGPYVTGFLAARGGIGLVFGTLSLSSLVAMALATTL